MGTASVTGRGDSAQVVGCSLLVCGDRDRNQKAYRIEMHAPPQSCCLQLCQMSTLSTQPLKSETGVLLHLSFQVSNSIHPQILWLPLRCLVKTLASLRLRCLLRASLPVSRVSFHLSDLFLTQRLEKFL